MAEKHLSTARLMRLHDGATDSGALRHLASCPTCRRVFDDSRWTRLLGSLDELVADGSHPGRDELAAYHAHALSSARTSEIEAHLRSCRSCLATLGRAREAERSVDYLSPSPDLVRTTQERFEPRRTRRLGTLLLSGIGTEQAALRFLPARRARDTGRGEGRRRHPGSALARAVRILRRSGAAADAGAPAGRIASEPYRAARPSVRITDGGRDLILTTATGRGQRQLEVRLVDGDGGQPTSNVRVRIRRANGDETAVVTDGRGFASLPVADGDSEILIDGEPRLVLQLEMTA